MCLWVVDRSGVSVEGRHMLGCCRGVTGFVLRLCCLGWAVGTSEDQGGIPLALVVLLDLFVSPGALAA
jgi:hypothetical protein